MKRKGIAQDTLRYMQQGYYEMNGRRVDFAAAQQYSEDNSVLITPEQGAELVRNCTPPSAGKQAEHTVANEATVQAILDFARAGTERVGVLNFASAKNPGGGFLNGAMAQEESLAASSGLYATQLRHEGYYRANRACKSMMYTDHAIYSPDVVFFRDKRFELLEQPVTASVLTLPAVNYGQVLLKGEDPEQAQRVMQDRMRLALAIFADRGDRNLVLGAYGCGVFRNDPELVAGWWQELLLKEGYGRFFERIVYAVLDRAKDGKCIRAFDSRFGSQVG
ncbi:TIGR02452 family protein [Paenibacillus dendritiformis]|uniref:TIGR02452 family protein n=1 Tax=Paenibacillus dendritiformis TaxID=130049 RepID=UPI00248D2870|nr:TIGR02452 family protein [Paenibacillus dendritiformis]WGU93402.1 TIGR02452 family protein [Paenibacillus dendritiformis]